MGRNPVIGYTAHKTATEVACQGESCLVFGSEQAAGDFLRMRNMTVQQFTLRKARFEDILAGMSVGGEYGFDRDAYARFAPAGVEVEIPKVEFDFTPSEPGRVKFLHLKMPAQFLASSGSGAN